MFKEAVVAWTRFYPGNFMEGLRKPRKSSIIIIGVRSDTRSHDLRNRNVNQSATTGTVHLSSLFFFYIHKHGGQRGKKSTIRWHLTYFDGPCTSSMWQVRRYLRWHTWNPVLGSLIPPSFNNSALVPVGISSFYSINPTSRLWCRYLATNYPSSLDSASCS
jgi:hypothetical protein